MDDFGDSIKEYHKGMFKYVGGENNNLISEASLTRLLKHYRDGSFAIITAYRSDMTKKEKINQNRKLRGKLNSMKMGPHQLVGHWRECSLEDVPYKDCPKDKLKDVIERSYFVPKRDEITNKEFEKMILSLVKEFNQDGAVLSLDGTIYIIYKTGDKEKIGTKVSLNKIAQGYSQHVKKLNVPFTFEGIEQPASISGYRAMKYYGIKYII